jgi:hypothetical protein
MTNRIIGVERTKAALKLAQVKLEATAPAAEHASAEIVARNMQARVPVRTGRLRASIRADGSSASADVSYAIPVDRGTTFMRAQPYAEDAAKASIPEIVATMTAAFRTALGGR